MSGSWEGLAMTLLERHSYYARMLQPSGDLPAATLALVDQAAALLVVAEELQELRGAFIEQAVRRSPRG